MGFYNEFKLMFITICFLGYIFLVSGCSGHGFKFTVLLGKIISMLATDDHSYDKDLSRFKLTSFLK